MVRVGHVVTGYAKVEKACCAKMSRKDMQDAGDIDSGHDLMRRPLPLLRLIDQLKKYSGSSVLKK